MTEEDKPMTYAGVGVEYDAMDPFKIAAQMAGRETARNIRRLGMEEVHGTRGESAYLVATRDGYLAHVEEGLGTKNLVADAMYALTGKSYYDHIAQDTVAMIVNDLITVGAMPISCAMHLAVGSSDWFKDETRLADLINGWKRACDLAFCVWGGGETPTLKGIVAPNAAVLSGSAMGIVSPKGRLIRGDIREGDAIVLLPSSGIHANGLTLARRIAEKLPKGYLTELPDGRTYGETLLDPTFIYGLFVETALMSRAFDAAIDVHYAINITGHGWRKLMRAVPNYAYVIETLPPPLPIFGFLQEHGPIDDMEAYGNLNMGAGFALIVNPRCVNRLFARWAALPDQPFQPFVAGHVEKSQAKKVVIRPNNLEFAGMSLAVR